MARLGLWRFVTQRSNSSECAVTRWRVRRERLDALEKQVHDLSVQNASLAESQTSLLQASICLVKELQEELQKELQAGRAFCETNDYEFRNPEVGLIAFLFSFLPTPKAIDAGAHIGEVSERLLGTGYEVYAFEPNPVVYKKLTHRLDGRRGFHPFNFALGNAEADMPLHIARDLSGSNLYEDESVFSSLLPHSMPDDLPFTTTVTVSVKSLASLHRAGLVPTDVSLVKIDTEGYDLEVIRGMEEHRYPVVVAEFWDSQIPFATSGVPYTLESLSAEMRERGYPYYIVLYRIWGQDPAAFYCNRGRSLPNAYGNVFFFSEYGVFREGRTWCSAVLPETYFKPLEVNLGALCSSP